MSDADLRPRIEALEARNSAIEARQQRIEGFFGTLLIAQHATDKALGGVQTTLLELVGLVKAQREPLVVVAP